MVTKTQRHPDFVIAGAMKCGTTWLHDALNSLSQVYIPREEIHLYDSADPMVHPDFQTVGAAGLRLKKPEETRWFGQAWDVGESQLIGFDSTTLFHSRIDLEQLRTTLPETRFVVLLRDPVSRAYSHYWHLVRTGRARYGFEKELLFGKQEILYRSEYTESVRAFRQAFGEQCLFVCFENVFRNPESEIVRILEFLGIDSKYKKYLLDRLNSKSNEGRYPNFLPGWLFVSRIAVGLDRFRYSKITTYESPAHQALASFKYSLYRAKQVLMVIGGLGFNKTKPKLNELTRRELNEYFEQVNRHLNNELQTDFDRFWYNK